MTGHATLNGFTPTKYVSPLDVLKAKEMVIGTMRYFDYENHDNVRKMAKMYFDNGYPFDPPLAGVFSD